MHGWDTGITLSDQGSRVSCNHVFFSFKRLLCFCRTVTGHRVPMCSRKRGILMA